MDEMERLLMLYIENNVQNCVPLSSAIIQVKSSSLCGELKKLCLRDQVQSLSQAVRDCLRSMPTFITSLCRVNLPVPTKKEPQTLRA
jgi:hypothetical protein